MLVSSSFVVPISRLPAATQEEIIHWVFNNEDRYISILSSAFWSLSLFLSFPSVTSSSLSYSVWRYRGGRDGHETLQQFMNFLNPKSHDQTSHAYPGVAVFFLPSDPGQEVDITRDFRVSTV